MDPSVLIFVALAAAWAAYLVPKALQHHDAAERGRPVERFSRSMRVLARREVVDRRSARLVVQPGRASATTGPEVKASPEPVRQVSPAARRAAAKRATQRRQRVLALILTINAAVIGPAIGGVISGWWSIAPVVLLIAWLVACRVMVKSERAARTLVRDSVPSAAPQPREAELGADDETGAIAVVDEPVVDEPVVEAPAVEFEISSSLIETPAASTGEFSAVTASTPGLWDPVPTTLPTYVSKPAAVRRTVSTIDLDSTGVWSSGRNEIDSALAREAEQIAKVEKANSAEASSRRVSGA